MTGVLITAVDTTIVVLALPEIERGLHVALASVIWVVIGYLLVVTLLASQVGRLGDMYGRVRMYETGFVVFIVGSALCALSWDQASIIAFRALQGVGGALVSANSGAVIADLFPADKRGRAYGFNGIGWSTGAVLGIVLGGRPPFGPFGGQDRPGYTGDGGPRRAGLYPVPLCPPCSHDQPPARRGCKHRQRYRRQQLLSCQ